MRIQVESAHIDKNKIIHIWGPAVDDLRRCRDERGREDRVPMKHFCFRTREKEDLKYAIWFLHDQVVTKGCKTYGEAIQAIVGTTVNLKNIYLESGNEGLGA